MTSVACGLSIIGGVGDDPNNTDTRPPAALPDGSILLADGAVLLPDGNVIPLPDGAVPPPEAGLDAPNPNPNPCGAVLATDPQNCGTCGHSCLGGACVAGRCAPIVLASNEVSACAIAVDATTIYIAQQNSGKLRKLPINGGTVTDLHSTGKAPHDLVLDGDRLYWGDQEKAGWVGLSGAAMGMVKGSPGAGMFGARAIAKTTNGLYSLANDNVNYFKRADLTQMNGSIGVLNGQASIATTATHVYWVSDGAVHRAPIGAQQAEAGNVLNVNATSLATDSTHIYWTAGAQVARAKLSDFIPEMVSTTESNARSIAVDASGVYWADFTANTIRFRSSSGSTPVTIAPNGGQLPSPQLPRVIALDAVAVYFVSSMGNTVSKVAK
jgi:hypothetical protein